MSDNSPKTPEELTGFEVAAQLCAEYGFDKAAEVLLSFKGFYVLYYPPGTVELGDGRVVCNSDLARELVERIQHGSIITIPNTPHSQMPDRYAWDFHAVGPAKPIPIQRCPDPSAGDASAKSTDASA